MASLAIRVVCPESFSAIHVILIMGTKGYLGILVKLYPGPSVVLEVGGAMCATLISLKDAQNVACYEVDVAINAIV